MNVQSIRSANICSGVAMLLSITLSVPAVATTLSGALQQAYQSNPQLHASRAALRASDEAVAIARGGYRPTLSLDAVASQSDQDAGSIGQGRIGLQADQSLFDGSVTRNTVRSAQTRFDVGDETKTAIAEAQARQAEAVAQLARAQAQLAASEATYLQVVGVVPSDLQAAILPESLLPSSQEQAIEQALETHPSLVSAAANAQAARFDVERTRGALQPTLGLSARVEQVVDDLASEDPRDQDGQNASVSLQFRLPLYQAGVASARVRQARQILEQRSLQIEALSAQLTAGVQSAWAQRNAANAAQQATQTQIESAQLARDGKLNEQSVGLVTTLDVLNAQQDVLAAELAASNAQRDSVLAGFALVAATGNLSVQALELSVEPYEPGKHFSAVNRQWFGTRAQDYQ